MSAFYRTTGRFNWANQSQVEAQWVVSLPSWAPVRSISDTMDIDGEHDEACRRASEDGALFLIEAIAKAKERYWIDTHKAEFAKTMEWVKANERALRKHYALLEMKEASYLQQRAFEKRRAAMAEYEDACTDEAVS